MHGFNLTNHLPVLPCWLSNRSLEPSNAWLGRVCKPLSAGGHLQLKYAHCNHGFNSVPFATIARMNDKTSKRGPYSNALCHLQNRNLAMSRSRYEPVPQIDHEAEVIDLSALDQISSYNYNTAVPNSPPPSFHSSQSVDLDHDRIFDNTTPRPGSIAPSAAPTAATEALIVNLHRRIERLEETIGRLIVCINFLLPLASPLCFPCPWTTPVYRSWPDLPSS